MPRIRRIAATSLTVLVVAAFLIAGWNAVVYRVLPWQAVPSTIHWCGRDYVNATGAHHTLAEIKAMDPRPIQDVGYYIPLNVFGSQLYASVTPEARRNIVSPPLPCSMGLYVRTITGQYAAYALSGGP